MLTVCKLFENVIQFCNRAGYVSDFGYFLIPIYLVFRQLCSLRIFSHNAIGNLIADQEIPIGFSLPG